MMNNDACWQFLVGNCCLTSTFVLVLFGGLELTMHRLQERSMKCFVRSFCRRLRRSNIAGVQKR